MKKILVIFRDKVIKQYKKKCKNNDFNETL